LECFLLLWAAQCVTLILQGARHPPFYFTSCAVQICDDHAFFE
jgi:hypothetical protein